MGNPTKLPGTGLNVGSYVTMDADGYLYQRGVKITKTAEQINDFVAGTPEDGSITDAKLATAVKVGNVATLTTDAKTNVVGAINEVDAHADAATTAVAAINSVLGNMATATTTAKTVVGAINELDAENAAFATKTGEETLTNKTLTSPVLSTPKISDGDAGLTITSADQTNAAAVATIPDIGGAADDFVMKDTAQTLTNKKLTDPSCTFTIGTHDYDEGAEDWTLSAEELLKTVHKPTNASGPVNAIIADTAGIPYVFINGTGQTLTVKTATGDGPTIANGKTAIVMSDGINVIALAAESE
jgi:hypothetical protein